jgi:N-acetyl sugar amidotransferase
MTILQKLPYQYNYKMPCSCCIMDDSVQGITFDNEGVCSFCQTHYDLEKKYKLGQQAEINLKAIIDEIKQKGKNKNYDCIVGVSGGKDSSYTLVKVAEFGLRPLVIHFDNGWNSDIAVQNIKNLCSKLNLHLHTHVADWEEFKDLQKSFLFASVPEGEVPTDYVITSVLYQMAAKEGIKYVVTGNTFRTEGTTPLSWTYQDPKYVRAIHKKFGIRKIRSFPIMNTVQFLYYSFIKRIRFVRLLYYIDYHEDNAIEYLSEKYDWKNYGGKHFESTYTKFYQSYILTRKFNIDKRKLHYSAKIRSGQITRGRALELIQNDPYEGGIESIMYTLKKLDLTVDEFNRIMQDKPLNFMSYPSLFKYVVLFRKPILWATKLGVLPDVIAKKYYSITKSKFD